MDSESLIKNLKELEAKARVSDFTSDGEDQALRKAIRVLSNVRQLFGEESPVWG